MESLAGTPDSECSFLDTQIFDPICNYSNKRVGRYVCDYLVSELLKYEMQGKKMETSEDEISIAGSPSVTRRRLGSFNNGQNASVSGKEEKSPGNSAITTIDL